MKNKPLDILQAYDMLTLMVTDTETETKTDKIGTEANGNLCWYLSLYNRLVSMIIPL